MAVFSSFIWIAAICFFVFRIIKKSQSGISKPSSPVVEKSIGQDYSSVRRGSTTIKDDRRNDWLAKQLREEHEAFKRTSAMFDLKIEHAASCDAEKIRIEHQAACDAHGIDDGNVTTAS